MVVYSCTRYGDCDIYSIKMQHVTLCFRTMVRSFVLCRWSARRSPPCAPFSAAFREYDTLVLDIVSQVQYIGNRIDYQVRKQSVSISDKK